MSLIINALKKAEDGGENQPEPKVDFEPKPVKKESKYSLKSDIFIIAVFASIIGVSFSFFFLKFADMSGKEKKAKPVVLETEPKEIKKAPAVKKVEVKTNYLEKIKSSVDKKPKKLTPVEIKKPAPKKAEPKVVTPKVAVPVKKEQPKLYKGSEYVLNGIMYDSRNPMALVNNKLVYVGKTVDRLRVLRITETEVFVDIDNQQYILSME